MVDREPKAVIDDFIFNKMDHYIETEQFEVWTVVDMGFDTEAKKEVVEKIFYTVDFPYSVETNPLLLKNRKDVMWTIKYSLENKKIVHFMAADLDTYRPQTYELNEEQTKKVIESMDQLAMMTKMKYEIE